MFNFQRRTLITYGVINNLLKTTAQAASRTGLQEDKQSLLTGYESDFERDSTRLRIHSSDTVVIPVFSSQRAVRSLTIGTPIPDSRKVILTFRPTCGRPFIN